MSFPSQFEIHHKIISIFRILASLASDSINHYIETDLKEHGITFNQCPKQEGHKSPNSYIILNATGTRTILHTNLGLPELTYEDFQKVDVSKYSWIHFEGRPAIGEIQKMLQYISNLQIQDKPGISLEMEKLNRNYDPLLQFVDVIFVSKEYAQSLGFKSKLALVEGLGIMKKLKTDLQIICAWGEEGAAGKDSDGTIIDVPAHKPPNGVIDTIGAGDTFNASVVSCLSQKKSLKEALTVGCKVAGTKVGQVGFKNLKDAFQSTFSTM